MTQTVASQSTAPKWSSTRRPAHSSRHLEGPAIPEPVGVLHHAREGRLDRERHEDLLGERPARADGGLALLAEAQLPEAVEVQPVLADELRPGILGVDAIGPDVLGPARRQRPLRRPPPPVAFPCSLDRQKETPRVIQSPIRICPILLRVVLMIWPSLPIGRNGRATRSPVQGHGKRLIRRRSIRHGSQDHYNRFVGC